MIRFSTPLATLLIAASMFGCGDDTTTTDTGTGDTGTSDTGTGDTGTADTGAGDTGTGDGGEDAGATESITINFAAMVGEAAFACGGSYDDIGTTNTTVVTNDFRFYVHDIRLITDDTSEIALDVANDGMWALDGTVLLDFEDGSTGCDGGNPETNTSITGTVPSGNTYVGLAFQMGVPFDQNHNIDAATADPPLNLTSMFWNWQGGYKFLRIDGTSTGLGEGWRQHLGSTGCDGEPTGGVTMCTNPNNVAVAFAAFDADTQTVAADLALLLAGSDMDTNTADTPPGCMATPTDPDCGPVFGALGLPFMDAPAGTQTFFRVQ